MASGIGLGVSQDIGTIPRRAAAGWAGCGRMANEYGCCTSCRPAPYGPRANQQLPAPAPPHCSWLNLFNADALTKLVPTLLSCAALIATLEHFSHPLALPAGGRRDVGRVDGCPCLEGLALPRWAGLSRSSWPGCALLLRTAAPCCHHLAAPAASQP